MADQVVYLPDPTNPDSPCTDCVYSVPGISEVEDEGPILKCHRYPPHLFLDEDGLLSQMFPDALEWCGEYRPRL